MPLSFPLILLDVQEGAMNYSNCFSKLSLFPNRTEKLLNHQDLILGWKTDELSILSIDFIINILVGSLCLHGHLPPAFSQCHDECVCVFQMNYPDCILYFV